ncbi:MAG: radical SAM family heme chaperone HemW, partial [Actinomycetia bacterium]|nr:radical SAM family heme chaperone HemW [Actinomycetes bacterium]
MPSTLPDGDPVPDGGALPGAALASLSDEPFGIYVHVPFCATRCGYCDFNTYTATELGSGASRDSYADTVADEIALAARVLGSGAPTVSTVFFGGGTPTLLPDGALPRILERIDAAFGLAVDAEVTTEANPDSVDSASLTRLREGGINRISFGVQSAVPHVLATLDRTHDSARVPEVVTAARDAGFDQLSVDLIYGTPGESLADWQASLDYAAGLAPDHVSAYALIVEEGTALARHVARGEVVAPDDDTMADKYLLAEQTLSAAGLGWYELSNWARTPAARCRHNELYWTGANWWGFGPGAHSHVGGVRWWNVKHPAAYAGRLAAGRTPAHAREVLDSDTRRIERILLESRLRDGLA